MEEIEEVVNKAQCQQRKANDTASLTWRQITTWIKLWNKWLVFFFQLKEETVSGSIIVHALKSAREELYKIFLKIISESVAELITDDEEEEQSWAIKRL